MPVTRFVSFPKQADQQFDSFGVQSSSTKGQTSSTNRQPTSSRVLALLDIFPPLPPIATSSDDNYALLYSDKSAPASAVLERRDPVFCSPFHAHLYVEETEAENSFISALWNLGSIKGPSIPPITRIATTTVRPPLQVAVLSRTTRPPLRDLPQARPWYTTLGCTAKMDFSSNSSI